MGTLPRQYAAQDSSRQPCQAGESSAHPNAFSRLHLAEATERGGFRHPPKLEPHEYQWPDGTSPETAAWAGVDGFMDIPGTLALALDGEQRSYAFYAGIAAVTRNPRVKAMAEEFAAEEGEHVAQLEQRIAKLPA